MDSTIIIAIISGLCVAVPSVLATLAAHNKSSALMEYKIEELTKKVEKHNNVIERVVILERDAKTMWDKIDELKHKQG